MQCYEWIFFIKKKKKKLLYACHECVKGIEWKERKCIFNEFFFLIYVCYHVWHRSECYACCNEWYGGGRLMRAKNRISMVCYSDALFEIRITRLKKKISCVLVRWDLMVGYF